MNKIDKDAQINRSVYHFPKIPIEQSSGKENGFQPVGFGGTSEFTSGVSEGPGDYVEEIKKQAYAAGFNNGEKAGLEASRKQIEPVLKNLREALLELGRIRKDIYLKAEKDIIGLSLAIAKKIVGNEISTNKNVISNVLKAALKEVVDSEKIKIKISPADLNTIKSAGIDAPSFFDDIEDIVFEADETIADGGCVVITNAGDIDARIEKQLEVMEETVKSEFQESGTGA